MIKTSHSVGLINEYGSEYIWVNVGQFLCDYTDDFVAWNLIRTMYKYILRFDSYYVNQTNYGVKIHYKKVIFFL